MGATGALGGPSRLLLIPRLPLQAGHPWRASRTPERADLFLDMRVPPTITLVEARRAVKRLFLAMKQKYSDYGLEFETYVSVPGATIDENHEMVLAIERNHHDVMGNPPARDTVLWCSRMPRCSRVSDVRL